MTTKTLGEFFELAMHKHANNSAFICSGQQLNFSELEVQSRKLALWLQSILNKGDRVAVQLPNINQYPLAAIAVLRAGLVLVNTNPFYTPNEMVHQFSDSGAKVLITLSTLSPSLEEVLPETDIETVILVGGEVSNKTLTQKTQKPYYYLHDILSEDRECQLSHEFAANPNDVAVLQYTGGTTGVAKGACLTHLNILSNVEQIHERLSKVCIDSEETIVCPLPLYHIYAFTVNMVYMFGHGNLNILIPNPRDLDYFIQQLKAQPFTALLGINTLFIGLTKHPAFAQLDFSHLKLTLSGGTTLVESVASEWKELTECSITEGYGLSETSPVVTLNMPGDEEVGTIGRSLVDTEVEIRDANGYRVSDNQPGELLVKGPQVMKGYWQRPESTSDVFTDDGFFKTGDVAIRQTNGNFRIVDRLKELIIVSGFNVYPNEVEAVLVSHPSIIEAAVVGIPFSKTGEAVHAYVAVSKSIQAEDIKHYCKEYLTAYKIPSKIIILDELPKSSVGKILRRDLRQSK
ncbi:AMP-binding protein [Pseudoalteromonas lipolytica]|uniref:Long-chain-fatty-acid--CoA ligase n=1 Tax=Pseudoalteromonas lipolytica TaxID=570156 RepID=A0ABU8SZ47_9GAMM